MTLIALMGVVSALGLLTILVAHFAAPRPAQRRAGHRHRHRH